MDTKKSVIILRGLPGSGKSTFLQSFMLPHIHISMDHFWTKDGQPYSFDYKRLAEAIEWTHKQFVEKLEAEGDLPIVVDNVSYAFEHYRFFWEEARKRGINVHIVHIERPFRECVRAGTHNVPVEKLLNMAEKWEAAKDTEFPDV